MVFSVVSFATLTGPPIGGALISTATKMGLGNDYVYAQAFSGSALVAGSVILVAARIAKAGPSVKVKV
jgi:hypothetical protein